MKKVLLGMGVLVGVVGVCLTIMAAQYEPKVPAGVTVVGIEVGDMSRDQAAHRLRSWWDQERRAPISLRLEGSDETFSASATKLGVALDDAATVNALPVDGFFARLRRKVTGERAEVNAVLKFKATEPDLTSLREFVESRVPERKPARVTYRAGTFQRTPEVVGFTLDDSAVFDAALDAYQNQTVGIIPVRPDAKKVSDADLLAIDEVSSEFTTRFSEGKVARSSNIRLAASLIDGIVLAPGEQFSFNKTVGRRTAARGFKEAGVYKDGKHDIDIGGGICQVSTTLYNAALFGNLKIVRRSNHSMPVPYVPIGRDATVDYGTVDLVIENSTDKPIAISATVGGGSITFRILGRKDPEASIKVVSGPAKSWDVGQREEPDPTLPAGKTRVIEKGSRGHSVATYRVVYRNGEEVKREPLGTSVYRGGKRIIAVGTAAPATPSSQPPIATETNPPGDGDGL